HFQAVALMKCNQYCVSYSERSSVEHIYTINLEPFRSPFKNRPLQFRISVSDHARENAVCVCVSVCVCVCVCVHVRVCVCVCLLGQGRGTVCVNVLRVFDSVDVGLTLLKEEGMN